MVSDQNKGQKKKIIGERINLKIEFKLNFLKQSVIIRFGCFIDSNAAVLIESQVF